MPAVRGSYARPQQPTPSTIDRSELRTDSFSQTRYNTSFSRQRGVGDACGCRTTSAPIVVGPVRGNATTRSAHGVSESGAVPSRVQYFAFTKFKCLGLCYSVYTQYLGSRLFRAAKASSCSSLLTNHSELWPPVHPPQLRLCRASTSYFCILC